MKSDAGDWVMDIVVANWYHCSSSSSSSSTIQCQSHVGSRAKILNLSSLGLIGTRKPQITISIGSLGNPLKEKSFAQFRIRRKRKRTHSDESEVRRRRDRQRQLM